METNAVEDVIRKLTKNVAEVAQQKEVERKMVVLEAKNKKVKDDLSKSVAELKEKLDESQRKVKELEELSCLEDIDSSGRTVNIKE